MKYKILPIHIHTLQMPILPINTFADGKLNNTIHVYPIVKDKIHPFRIDWKYRVFIENKHLFSYIGEVQYLIQDDGIDFDFKEMDMFIRNLYINFELGWQERTKKTPLEGTSLPAMVGENLNLLRQQIIHLIQ